MNEFLQFLKGIYGVKVEIFKYKLICKETSLCAGIIGNSSCVLGFYVLIKRSVMFFYLFSILKEWLNPDKKLNAILRPQYHSILAASWEKIYTGIGRSCKAMEPNTRIYSHPASRQYNVILLSQNHILVYRIRCSTFRLG